jgi:CHAT domain-containing protein
VGEILVRRGALLAGAALGVLLAAGAAHAQRARVELKEPGDEAAVGANATGEPCRIRLLRGQRYGLFCEGWRVQSGELRRSRPESDVTATALLEEEAWPRDWASRVQDCKPAEATTFVGSDRAALRECKRADGGWPVVIAAARLGPRAYLAESLPTNLRVLERAALMLEGKAPAPGAGGGEGVLSAAIRRAETLHGADGKLIGVQDVGALDDLRELGKRYHRSADFVNAELTQRRALEIQERLLGVGHFASAPIVTDIAGDLSKQGRFAEADQMFAQAEALAQRARPEVLTSVLAYRSTHETIKGNFAEAARYARLAVPPKDERKGRPTVRLGHAYFALAIASYHMKNWPAAGDAAEDALTTFAAPGGRYSEARLWWEGETYELLGRIRRQEGRYADARAAFERARERRWVMYGDTPRVARSYAEIGNTYRDEGNLATALEYYRKSSAMSARDRRGRESIRNLGVGSHLTALHATLAAAPADARPALAAEALTVIQIPRASETSQAVQAMASRLAQGDVALSAAARDLQDAMRRRDAARLALAQETLNPPAEREAGREDELKAAYRKAEEDVDRLEERLQATFPRYARLMAESPLTADEARALLRPGEALLVLLPSLEATHVLLVRDGALTLHRAPVGASALAPRVAALRPPADAGAALPPFDLAAAHALYRDLLGPLAAPLAGTRHLLVVPSGPLLSLPLGVLVTRPPAAPAEYARAAWLARDMAVSVLPSVSSLRDLRKVAGGSAAPKPFIGFGDPTFSGAPGDLRAVVAATELCRGEGRDDAALVRALPRLPDTARELSDIARILGAPSDSVVLGPRATEAAVRSAGLDQYKVIAFATHGLLPGELRCKSEPALALTPPAASTPGAPDDGLLVVSEIATLRLDADWVVLSACNTAGPGGKLGGESLSGLARGFLYAGARGLLVSHWAVASRPTVQLTTGAFAALAREPLLGRAEALRRAQLALAGDPATAHPYFWAPYVLVGDGGPVSR